MLGGLELSLGAVGVGVATLVVYAFDFVCVDEAYFRNGTSG